MLETKRSLTARANRPTSALRLMEQERRLMRLGAEHGWSFRALGQAPVPTTAVFHKGWWLVPIAEDHSQIPARSLERVRAIYAAGIRPKTFVIAHEARPEFPAPKEQPETTPIEIWAKYLASQSVVVAKVAGTVLTSVVVPLVAAGVSLGLLTTLGVLSTVAMIDPCLVAITEDNMWIEIDSWMI